MKNSIFNAVCKTRYLALLVVLIFTCGNAWGESGSKVAFGGTSGTSADKCWSFTSAKNNATNAPAYSSSQLRLYYASNGNGCSATITAASGYKLTKIVIYTSTTSYRPTVKFYDSASPSGTSTTPSWGTGTTLTYEPASSQSNITFQNANTSNTQLRTTYIEVYYEVSGGTTYTVTLKDDGDTRTQASAGASVTLPARAGCAGYTFAGWTKTWVTDQKEWTTTAPTIIPAGNYTPTANENLYPVYTKEEGGGEPVETKTQTFQYDTWEYGGSSTDKSSYRLFHDGGYVESASDVDFSKLSKVIVYGGTFGGTSYNGISIKKADGTLWKNATVSGSKETGTNTITGGASLTGSAKLRVYSTKGTASGTGVRISKVEVYTMEGGTTTSYISVPNCCTPLGSVNGSVAFTNPAAAVVSWDNLEHVSSWTVKYKVHGAANWTTWEGAQSTASSRRSVTITTICNTAYDFLIIATPASGYCDKEEELNNSGSGYNSGKWIVGYTLTDINKTSGPDAGANVCGDFSAIFAATNSKVLPATITVTIGGSAQTAGTDYTWDQSSGTLSISSAKITGTIAITISGATAAYQFWYGPSNSGDGWISTAFASVGNNEHQITNFVIPAFEWDGSKQLMWNVSGSGISATNREFYAMTFAHTQSVCGNYDYYNDGNNKDGWIRGPMPGAIGTLRIYDNKGDNGWCAFIPNEYVLKFGTSEILFTNTSGSVWETAITDLSSLNSGSWTGSTTYQVGVGNSSHSFVAISNKCPATELSSMGYKTNAGENWGTGLNNISSARGKFRIWIDNCSNNWVAHFVPYHRVVFHSNYPEGGGPADTYAGETSVEESNASIALNPAPTAPTGYTFDGWYDAASGGNKITTPLSISAGASADIELYAQWAANTINLTLDKNNSDDSGSSNGSGTIMFDGNATATITGATRTGHTVEGYYSDAACTAANKVLDANGNVINSTVSGYTTSGKWTRATTSTTLYTKWTPNNYTITWSVNNQTWTHGVTDANDRANHGATVNAPAGDGNVPTGAAMPCGTYTFMGWSADITPTSENGGTAPADLFTTTSPAITKETTFYAVFAETSGSGDTELTTAEITAAYCSGSAGCGAQTSYANGPYTISSDGGNWYGVCAINSGNFTLRSDVASQSLGRPYMLSPNYGASVSSISINATHTANSIKYIYICASATDDPANNNIGSIAVPKNNTEPLVIEPSSSTQQFYMYVNGAVTFTGITVSYGSYSNYKTYCDNTKAYVNYNPAGGTTSCTREAVTKGTNYTVCSSVPTKTGYTFQGWLSNETTPQTYQPNATISNVQNDIVLTAQWTATIYTITYNGVKTGAENTNPISYTVEDLPINLAAATHGQWRFDGWTDDNAGNADITTIPAGTTGNQSFTAHWTQRYAVTWYEESTPTVTYFDPGATLQFPADPSAPASCSEKKFVGWMVGTITGETDDKPTFITAGEVNADAAYHAVWANFAGSAIAAVEDNTFTQSDVSRETYCGISNGLQSVGKYVQNQSIWNASQMTGVHVKIKVYHVSNDRADVLRISLINSSGEEVVGTDLTTSKLGNSSSSAGYSSNVTLTPTTAVTGYKVSLKTKNSSGTSVGKVTREVVPAYSKYSTSCCDNNVAAPSVTATATRNSITLSWANVTDATGYKVTINGGTHEVTTAACTYTASGLNSGTDYAWTVIATYNPANYCGAIPTKNTTTTLSVYGVTYNKNTTIGSGTVTMSPMPSDASTYVVGENVTAAAKPATCTNSGYTFNGWNTEPDGTGTHVDAGGTIAMVEGGLTLYAEWVAKRAYYVDRMHGQGDQTIEIGGKTYHCYYGDGYHITPSPSDQKSGDACQAPHYRFVRWLTIGHINADGTQKDTGGAVSGGVQRGTVTDGETYYAIWEEEIE